MAAGSIDNFFYDQYTQTAPLQTAAGAPEHDDANFGTAYAPRGNLTTHQSYLNENGGTNPADTFAWDMTGQEVSYTDFKLNTTTYRYGEFADAARVYPTTITNALGQKRSYTYDQNRLAAPVIGGTGGMITAELVR